MRYVVSEGVVATYGRRCTRVQVMYERGEDIILGAEYLSKLC